MADGMGYDLLHQSNLVSFSSQVGNFVSMYSVVVVILFRRHKLLVTFSEQKYHESKNESKKETAVVHPYSFEWEYRCL
ncbi:hypothetical protein [Paenibacillus polymyxa]|uniref:hypothetical protein n=1 Tax=Paenibacillus polymyxa TaxID=1406 RepID=UPI00287F9785|nr:hypothetical protein [Paenibacillus polymyxa]